MPEPKVIRAKKYGTLVIIEETSSFIRAYRQGEEEWSAVWIPRSKIELKREKMSKPKPPTGDERG